VKNDYGTEYEAWALNDLEEPLKKKLSHIEEILISTTVKLRAKQLFMKRVFFLLHKIFNY
jgi:hypothetical protein